MKNYLISTLFMLQFTVAFFAIDNNSIKIYRNTYYDSITNLCPNNSFGVQNIKNCTCYDTMYSEVEGSTQVVCHYITILGKKSGCKRVKIFQNTQKYIELKNCSNPSVEILYIWNMQLDDNNELKGHWNYSFNSGEIQHLFTYPKNKIFIQNRENWDGLLVMIAYKCCEKCFHNQCLTVKFIGERSYPLPNNIKSIFKSRVRSTTEAPYNGGTGARSKTRSQSTTLYINKKETNKQSIVGIIVGVLIGILVIITVALFIYFIRKKEKKRKKKKIIQQETGVPLHKKSQEIYAIPTIDDNTAEKQHLVGHVHYEYAHGGNKNNLKLNHQESQPKYYELEESNENEYKDPENINDVKTATKVQDQEKVYYSQPMEEEEEFSPEHPPVQYAAVNKSKTLTEISCKEKQIPDEYASVCKNKTNTSDNKCRKTSTEERVEIKDDIGNYYSPVICIDESIDMSTEYAKVQKKNSTKV